MNNEKVMKGTWVQVHAIVLRAEERTAKIPEDTKKVPLEMWVKGFLKEETSVGESAEIETLTGRNIKGTLTKVNPIYNFSFGDIYIPELLQIGIQARKIMKGEE